MNIKIISAHRVKERFIQEAIKEYSKRLAKYCKIDFITTNDVSREIRDRDYVIKIGKSVESISSEQLAKKIASLGIEGNSHIAIVFDGKHDNKKVDFILNLSNMDIDSDLMLIIVYEQIFRAYRIINNEPYHR